jgi:hypothetical protein
VPEVHAVEFADGHMALARAHVGEPDDVHQMVDCQAVAGVVESAI